MKHRALILSAASLLGIAGCSNIGKTTPAAMSARETTRAWISDGSAARFADTERLGKTSFEGWVDDRVAVRYGSLAPGDEGYEGEAEWTVEFAEPIAKLAASGRLSTSTKVRLRGMIEGKEMRGLAKPGRANWVPFSVGNNVITDDGTGWFSLGQFDDMGERYTISVTLRSREGKTFTHHSAWSDVGDKKAAPSANVLAVAEHFAKLTAEKYPEWKGVRLLNMSARGKRSAFVGETGRKIQAGLGVVVSPLEVLEGTARGGTPVDLARTRLGRQISAHDSAFTGRINLVLLDRGSIISRATLNLVSPYATGPAALNSCITSNK